ncbi:MAG: hypothetical protein HKN41_11540 [Ilumatobacter sp.]|nr:hypothetical protein [Ilumatobacter sp.]
MTGRSIAPPAAACSALLLLASCGGGGSSLPTGLIASTTTVDPVPITIPEGLFDTAPATATGEAAETGAEPPTESTSTESTSEATTEPTTSSTTSSTMSSDTSVPDSTSPDAAGTSADELPVEGPLVSGRGDLGYLHGANLPWVNWGCDFGCGDDGGASSDEVQAVAGEAFASAKIGGMRVVRWWVFPGEPTQIEVDGSRLPFAVADDVDADFDAALALADEHDIDLVFTLFSHPTALPEAWLTEPLGREALADALGGLFARYADHPRIHTWQVFNEPEWEIWNGLAEEADVRALVTAIAESVHANSDALVSVGGARIDGLGMWVGTGLDYYTAHWYDPMQEIDFCAVCTTYPELRDRYDLDAPVVIGEFYAGPDPDTVDRFRTFFDRGYAGAWAWSLLPERTNDRLTVNIMAAADFAAELPRPANR